LPLRVKPIKNEELKKLKMSLTPGIFSNAVVYYNLKNS